MRNVREFVCFGDNMSRSIWHTLKAIKLRYRKIEENLVAVIKSRMNKGGGKRMYNTVMKPQGSHESV